MDGTLLNAESILEPRALPHINQALSKGIRVTVATGRDPYSATQLTHPVAWQTPLITCNGAVLWDAPTQALLKKHTIPKDAVRHCLDSFPEFGLVPFVMEITQDLRFTVRPTSQEDSFHEVVKLYAMGGDSEIDAAKKKIGTLLDGTVSITSSLHGNLEVGPARISKASGLLYLSGQLGISPEEIACIGDGENDIEMFGFAGIRVAMGNAIRPLKSLADHVAPPNTEHGIAEALEWILSQTDP